MDMYVHSNTTDTPRNVANVFSIYLRHLAFGIIFLPLSAFFSCLLLSFAINFEVRIYEKFIMFTSHGECD